LPPTRLDAEAVVAALPPALRARREFLPYRDRAARLSSLGRHLIAADQARRILDAADAEALPLLPFKGVLLAEALYGDGGLRPMVDIDLVVQPRDLARALALLERLGFVAHRPGAPRWSTRHGHSIMLSGQTPPQPLDLHFRLFHELAGDSDAAPWFARAIELPLWGRARRVPSWEDQFFFAAMHGAVDGFSGPHYWVVDLALMSAHVDFARVAAEAERRGLRVAFAAALQLAHAALPAWVPPPPWPVPPWRGALLERLLGAAPLTASPGRARRILVRSVITDDARDATRELLRKVELQAHELALRLIQMRQ
jgi:hypothetical protein